jgi:hypothetical protein
MIDTDDFPFTRRDAEGLIDNLSEIVVKLPKAQWGLLLAIFAAAAGHVEVSADKTEGKFSGVKVDGGVISDSKGRDAEELRKQLRETYMPGSAPTSIVSMVTPPKKGGG